MALAVMEPQGNKPSAMNLVWILLILAAVLVGAAQGKLEEVGKASFQSAKQAVELAIGLVGAMAFWLGLMRVSQEAGLMIAIAKALRPLMSRLFPDVPPHDRAMGAMIMNIAANVMGLGNAATPLGIKAMQELDRLNPRKGEATDAMCLFLAINTSSVTLLPLGTMAMRASAGAREPGAIVLPTILATLISTGVAVLAAKGLKRFSASRGVAEPLGPNPPEETPLGAEKLSPGGIPRALGWRRVLIPAFVLAFGAAAAAGFWGRLESGLPASYITQALIPFLIGLLSLYGVSRGLPVYENLCEGGKEGFQVALRIIPFLVAIMVAVGMFRASGALDLLVTISHPVTSLIGMPAETLPMAMVRPLSGSGAFGIMAELVAKAPDSLEAFIACVMQGSTDTTFYILAVYFGVVQVTRIRYALWAGLMADAAGVVASVILGRVFWNG